MAEADDVVAVVVHGEPGQDGDGDAGAGRQQRKPVLFQSLLFHFLICRYISTTANVTSSVEDPCFQASRIRMSGGTDPDPVPSLYS
jgi:hypothetical protein